MSSRTPLSLPVLLGVPLLLVAGCAAGPVPSSTPSDVPHGFVDGAVELPDPQLRLVALDGSGSLTALDPATEDSVDLGTVDDVTRLTTDGRFLFASVASAGRVEIVDGGAWTVPHGDHSHYYLAEPRAVGRIEGTGEGRVASSASLTAAFFPESGETVIVDAIALADGLIEETGRVVGSPHDGSAVPIGDRVVVTVAEAPGASRSRVQVVDADGSPIAGASAVCESPRGSASTRVGVVVGCADGALLVTESEPVAAADSASPSESTSTTGSPSGILIERIAYPAGAPKQDIATAFAGRPGRPALAAVAGTHGAWLLDTRARSWTLVPTPEPLLRATAIGDTDDTIVAVGASGRVLVLTPGGSIAATEPLVAADLAADGTLPAGVTLEVDIARAYLNSPAIGVVTEIDYRDAARVARTLRVGGSPVAFVETGR